MEENQNIENKKQALQA